MIFLAFALGGCATANVMKKAEVDNTILTGSIDKSGGGTSDDASDEQTVRNAVTSADLEQLGDRPIEWANSDTGSRGSVDVVREYREKGVLCRTYSGSIESFSGVSMFSGDACLGKDGGWWPRSFARL